MDIEIRLYKQYDTDLISLYEAGYSVSTMMKEAVISYANGIPIHYYIDEITDFKMGVDTKFRTRFKIPESDTKTIYVLKHLKPRYRNLFCKTVLRNALVQQNLVCFFTDPSLIQLQNINLDARNPFSYKNMVPCSSLREHKQFEFAGHTITTNNKGRRKLSDVKIEPGIQNNPFSQNQNGITNNIQNQPVFANNFKQPEPQVFTQPMMQPVTPTSQQMVQPLAQRPQNQAVFGQFHTNSPANTGVYTGLPESFNGQMVLNPNIQFEAQPFAQQPIQPTQSVAPIQSTPQVQTQIYESEIEDDEIYEQNKSEPSSIGLANNDKLLSMFDNL